MTQWAIASNAVIRPQFGFKKHGIAPDGSLNSSSDRSAIQK
jgi:hypothetical protein